MCHLTVLLWTLWDHFLEAVASNKYILVISNYHYPEAIPLHSIDMEHVARELMVVFTRVGIPNEISTDQGT